jgi:NifU-like protein involved in Fe-S cluster formation
MTIDPYSPRVREYFANPTHVGELDSALAGYFADQGVRIRLTATVDDGVLSQLKFRAWGCPHVIAAAEAFCRQFEGRRVVDLEQFSSSQIMEYLAVPVEKTGRILVLEDTVRSLGQAIQDRTAYNTQD